MGIQTIVAIVFVLNFTLISVGILPVISGYVVLFINFIMLKVIDIGWGELKNFQIIVASGVLLTAVLGLIGILPEGPSSVELLPILIIEAILFAVLSGGTK